MDIDEPSLQRASTSRLPPGDGPRSDSEGEGEDLRPGVADSSEEEEEDDSEEERKIREGFIVDEEEGGREKRRKKKKKRTKERTQNDFVGALDEEDLELMATNAGRSYDQPSENKFKRIRRMRDQSPASDDLDRPDADLDLNIFGDDEDVGGLENFIEDDMGDFIEDDDDDPESRGDRRKEKQKQAETGRRRMGIAQAIASGGLKGFSAEAWEEVTEIFGDGTDYEYAMLEKIEDDTQQVTQLADVYEPAEIKERMLTAADEYIRLTDAPERLQAIAQTLPPSSREKGLGVTAPLFESEDELHQAAEWIAPRIDAQLAAKYVLADPITNQEPLGKEHFLDVVAYVLQEMVQQFNEVPFVHVHRKDYLMRPPSEGDNRQMLDLNHLWAIQHLAYTYRGFLDRKHALIKLHSHLVPDADQDEPFKDLLATADENEDLNEMSSWLNSVHAEKLRADKDAAEQTLHAEAKVEAGEEATAEQVEMLFKAKQGIKLKKAIKMSKYDRAKNSIVAKLADRVAITPRELAMCLDYNNPAQPKDEPVTQSPLDEAENYTGGDTFKDVVAVLAAVKAILTHELGIEPTLRRGIRKMYKEKATVSVKPTEKGMQVIDEFHPLSVFKYLKQKPVAKFNNDAQLLAILAAESDGLVTVTMELRKEDRADLIRQLQRFYEVEPADTEAEQQWNELRSEALQAALDDTLFPAAAAYTRERLRDEAQEFVALRCADALEAQIVRQPYASSRMERGQIPSVVAVSHGNGDNRKDSVIAVYLDRDGRLRDTIKLDNITPTPERNPVRNPNGDENRRQFIDFLKAKRADVIVVGGYTIKTKNLYYELQSLASDYADAQRLEEAANGEGSTNLEVVFVNDALARLYQSSSRADREYPALSQLQKYCVGLARFTQNPLNEYAAVGDDIVAIPFDDSQRYLSAEYLLPYLNRALVNVTNMVGVDINRAVRDDYYGRMLPYISGLGPRKAKALLQRLREKGGTLIARIILFSDHILTRNVFFNCIGFLRVRWDFVKTMSALDGENGPDILDDTRIHPEDYDIARKMASDALDDWDEEDMVGENPSKPVEELVLDDTTKLDALRLEEFAGELEKIMEKRKKLTLFLIRAEIKKPFADTRAPFQKMPNENVFRMLSGETKETLSSGLIVPAVVIRTLDPKKADLPMQVKLDSGVEGFINAGYAKDSTEEPIFPVGYTIRAVVIAVEKDDRRLLTENHAVELDCRRSSLAKGDAHYRRRLLPLDEYYDNSQDTDDRQSAEAKKNKAAGRQRRMIQHANFHNMTAAQAEEFLASQQRGDCVIRPSSKGPDHLACTWKVADGIYQHLPIIELNKPEGNSLALGRTLRIGGDKNTYQYTDLDELIYTHVRSMANKVDEMVQHEKFKGSEEELLTFLSNYQMANPDRPVYGFSWDRKNPGQFNLTFIVRKGQAPHTLPVKTFPNHFALGQANELPNVVSVCNAFKMQMQANIRDAQQGLLPPGRTPYMQGRAPNYPGARTPQYGQMVYQPPQGGQSPWRSQPQLATYRTTRTAYACAEFLTSCLNDVKAEDKEGLETAIQIIEEAFSINTNDSKQQATYSLKPASLQQIVDVFSKTKSSVKAGPSTTSPAPTTARDKAAAEDFKTKGNQLMASKDFEGAIAAYGQAIEKDSGNPVFYSNRAAAYSQANKHDQAIADARKAAEVDPKFSKAYSRLGHALYCSGQYSESVQAYEKGLELDPNNQTMKNSLATAKAKVPSGSAPADVDEDEDDIVDTTNRSGPGAGGFPGMSAGGGMPDLASMMNNPMIAQMAQSLMQNGGLESLMQNPALRSMAENFQNGGGMPDMSTLMNNPDIRNLASQFGGAGRGGAGGA